MIRERFQKPGKLQAREARWFVRGEIPSRPRGRPRTRVDSYHVESLAHDSAWKRRGERGPLEWKALVSAYVVEVEGVRGMAEQWVKVRRPRVELRGHWVAVHKELWRAEGLQVCRLMVEDEPWWSVALTVGSRSPAELELGTWSADLHDRGIAGSYPQWLLERARVHAHRRTRG